MSPRFERLTSLVVDGVDATWGVASLTWHARVGDADQVEAWLALSSGEEVEDLAEKCVGASAQLTDHRDGEDVTFHFVVMGAETSGDGLQLRLQSVDGLLVNSVDFRCFVAKSPIDAVTAVLNDHGIALDLRTSSGCDSVPQIVQQFETDWEFCHRILAEVGVSWLAFPEEARKVCLSDSVTLRGDWTAGSGRWQVLDDAGLSRDEDQTLFDVTLELRDGIDSVTLRDYDAAKPDTDTTVVAGDTAGTESYRFQVPEADASKRQARSERDLVGRMSERLVLAARTTQRGLAPGWVLDVQGLDSGVPTSWLVVETVKTQSPANEVDELAFVTDLKAIPASPGYRPPVGAGAKSVGVVSSTVAGAAGAEIDCDADSRIVALHRWDRRNVADQNASGRWRVSHPATSGGMMIPRTAWEELASHWHGDPRSPVTLGRLFECKAQPPKGLPASKTSSAIGTATTPGKGAGHNFGMDDTAGAELMSLHSTKDYTERTEKDRVTAITANDSTTVGASRAVVVGDAHVVDVTGAQVCTVGANRSLSSTTNSSLTAATETVMVGGARLFSVGGNQETKAGTLIRGVAGAKSAVCVVDDEVTVNGASLRCVAGSWFQTAVREVGVSVQGANALQVGGLRSVKCASYQVGAKSLTETHASHMEKSEGEWIWKGTGAIELEAGGVTQIKASSGVVFVATGSIEIEAGGVKVTISSGSVVIKGKYKSSQGSVDSATESYD